MLYRKIEKIIERHLLSASNKVLMVSGARQVGKTFIIRHVGKKLFKNYIEVNLLADFNTQKIFSNISSVDDFYLRLSSVAKGNLGTKTDTLVFLDEIQVYPSLLTMLKFIKEDDKFTYIASGSLLGGALAQSVSIPIGSIETIRMYPLDFEEFIIANGITNDVIAHLRNRYFEGTSVEMWLHEKIHDLFKRYLLIGGMPDAINSYLEYSDINAVRRIQDEIHQYYGADASQYDKENKLKIRQIYNIVPSNLENKRKRLFYNKIEGVDNKRYSDYLDEFDYLANAGITLEVRAISQPKFPLLESCHKNLLKLYLNDVGLLSALLYRNNVAAILDDKPSINLGSIYEAVVAQELYAHGHRLYYYDNKKNGEVDFLIEDYDLLSVVPIEVKSGKDYTVHSALNAFLSNKDYGIRKAIVFSNERNVWTDERSITYMPVYFSMFV